MNIKSIKWLGICTNEMDKVMSFYRDVLGLTMRGEGNISTGVRYAELATTSGDFIEVFDKNLPERDLFTAPVIGLLVEDVASARAELEAKGVNFIGPVYCGTDWKWSYFRGPEGHVFQIMGEAGR